MASYDQLDYAALFRSVNRDKPAEDPAKSRGFMRGAADLGLEAASGVTRGVGMLANVFGANNAVSQGARSADEFIREYLSAQSKEDSARASAILAEAEDAGIGDQVAAGLRAFAQNPVSTTVNALGQAVPVIAGALIPGMGPATVAGRVGMAGIGAAQGAGAVKGSIFDAVKTEQMRQPGMTEADATAAAEQAQSYTGQNAGNILGGAALGGVVGSTGFQPAAARILTRSGMLSQSTQQIEQGLLRKIGADKLADAAETRAGGALTGALVEGGTEFAQGGQEQYAANVALQREGFDVPTFRGVVSQGVMEAAAGGALGAGFGALEKPRSTRPPTIQDIAEAPTVDDAIKAFTNVLALPAPATKASWEVVDGQQLLQGPAAQTSQPATGMLGLPAPTGQPVLMADQFGNVTTQPATQRAEAISRANMAMAEAEQATAAQRQRTQELGKQTPRGESPPERIPVGEATWIDPIPTGDATELEQVPTGSATELDVETIQADDFLTADNQPYGTKTGATVRARREGLGPANVVAVPGGWVVRPQPTALSPAGQEVQPNNTRGTRAGDVLRAPNVNQRDMAAAAPVAVPAADGRAGDDIAGSGTVRPVADAGGTGDLQPGVPAAAGSGDGNVAAGRGSGKPGPLIPAEGTPLTLDGKPYTVAAAGKRYVTIADANGKERVISDGSYLWPKVQRALAGAAPDEGAATLKRLGFAETGPGPGEWVQKVSNLGDVIAKVVSKPGEPVRAEISADYLGKRLDTRTAEGEAAIKEAIERAREGINAGRERMARQVRADEGGLPAAQTQPTIGAPNDAATPQPAAEAPRSQETAPAATAGAAGQAAADTGAASGGAVEAGGVAQRRKLEADYAVRATEVLEEVSRRGDLPKLFKAFAGVRSIDRFTDLAIDEQASAYADYIESGAAPVTFKEAYNDRVMRMEKEAVTRRLQSDREVTQANGKPFKTEASAQAFQREYGLEETHKPRSKDGGFILAQRPPAEQADIKRQAAGLPSYAEVQGTVDRQMGLTEGPDGDIQATEAQFAERESRISALMNGQPVAPTTPPVAQPPQATAPTAPAPAPKTLKQRRDQAKAAATPAAPATPRSGPNVIINRLGPDGLTDAERAAGKAAYNDPPSTKPAPSANTVFTEDAAAAARARLKAKLGRLQSGLDPETMMDGITLAGYHVEKGARTFAAYARAMVDDLGDAVKPYLQSWYMALRADPKAAAFKGDMDKASTIEDMTAADIDALLADPDAPAVAAAGGLRDHLRAEIAANRMPKDNPALRKMVEAFDGAAPTQARMKEAQEDLEAAIVQQAREIVAKNKGEGDNTTFTILKRLYDSQPNLNIRTSTSIDNQAYSTPAPLAYLGARLADVTQQTTMYEPTGGNGMLAITAKPANVTATELDTQRAESLKAQGINVTQGDALKANVPAKSKDRVMTNPPFGPIKNDNGESVKVKFEGYTLGQIDHLIAARALESMKDDGKATLIIGANKATGQQSNNDLIFFNWLYGNYNVTSHFEVEGDLYQRQGAGWPVRVITIQGRVKSATTAPNPATIQRANTWSEVYERFQQGMDAGRSSGRTAASPVGAGAGRGGDAQSVPGVAAPETGRTDSSRPEGGAASDGNVPRERARPVGNRASEPAQGLGERPDAVGSNDQAPGPVEDAGIVVTEAAANAAGNPRTAGVASADPDNQFQTKYIARSDRKDEGVLIPVNMAGPTQDALNRLEDEVGNIDQFAAKELGYKSVAELHRAFMGLQVDSVASAISQIKAGKGIIIADQTGIGKGRQAAGIIRWAARNGKTPIFVTVKPSLFTDMYGDLHDIGTDDIQPLLMNVGESIKGVGDERLFANQPALHKRVLEGIANSGQLPNGRNALFMTYSQINVDNIQRKAVMALAPNAVFVLDESHNAGGASATGEFIKGALDLASGVTYLSATYAKRPDNMPVYFKTDIGEAVADDNTLMAAMAAGGLPLQTVVSNNLVKAGQMFRRERSYDGVSIESRADTEHKAEHVKLSDETTLALRAIVSADRTFHHAYVKALQKQLEKEGSRVLDMAGNQAQQSVDHTQFSSVVHNFVRQMLLGLKAQEAANDAIRSIKRGEKPLIAVEGTMGSFLAEYAENNNIKVGDRLGSFDYRTVLSRALERSRYIVRQLPNGDKVKEYIPMGKLDPLSFEAYTKAQAVIDKLKIDIPVSPIDWMRDQITKAGYTVAEVTGRNLSVDYSDPKKPKLSQIDQLEQKDKVRTTRQFNDGTLDAIILNVAGSTGISLHASEKFKDQRQRHMIVAQAAQDINIFMQMLGRVHRTGQVRLPKYTLLSADLPAEIRPTALLSGKMKSLNANTSSNTESATSVKAADMLNKYGDQIVQQYLADNFELAQALDLTVGEEGAEGEGGIEDIARKATGRLALMPVKTQEQFYAEVEEQYQALIDYLNKTNQNDLEPRTFDFDAQETKSAVLFEGQNKASPFGEDAMYGEYSVKAQGKAMTPAEIQTAMADNLTGKTASDHIKAMAAPLQAAFLKMRDGMAEEEQKSKADAAARAGADFLDSHKIGSMFRVDISGESYNAIVTNIRSTHKATGNPFSLSKIQVTIAVNGALRSVTLPATQFGKIEVSRITGGYGATIEAAFKEGPVNERETAKIVTGNLLGAYGEIEGVRGSIITFSKADGTTEQGILLPKAFNFTKDVRQDYRLKTAADVFKFLTNSTNENIERFGINSRDSVVRVLPSGQNGITIQVPKSKAKGGKYFLDKALREAAGDFVSSGNFMRATVTGEVKAKKALDVLMQKGALYALPSMAEEARQIVGDSDAPAADAKFSRATGQSTTPAQLRTALETEFTPETIGALERAGLLTIADRPGRGMPSDAAGVTQGGSIGLFAANTAPQSVAVAYHEALHATLKNSIGADTYTALMARLAKIDASAEIPQIAGRADVAVSRFFKQAAGRIPDDVTGEARLEELAAYAVEQYQTARERMPILVRRWAADFMAAVRVGLSKALQAAGVGVRIRARLLADPATLHKIARDGLQAMARQGAGQGMAAAFSRAYHGTHARGITKFDADFIGTGEGNQAYGYGLYFASKREIAEFYRRTVSGDGGRVFAKDGKTIDATRDLMEAYYQPGRIVRGYSGADKVLEFRRDDQGFGWSVKVVGVQANGDPMQFERPRWHSTQPDANALKDVLQEDGWTASKAGQVYEVEVPEDNELLHWDKPLSAQPEPVREALAPFLERYQASQRKVMSAFSQAEVEREIQAGQKTITGQEIYEQAGYMEGGGDRSASEYLRGLGIRGIKYLDATSRDGSGSSSNYVIFSGDDVQIQGAMYSRTTPTETATFKRMVQDAKQDLAEVLFNWNESELKGGDIIGYPGRDSYKTTGREGGKVTIPKREFLSWLMSEAPFDTKVYGPNIAKDTEWVQQIGKLRSIASPGGQFDPTNPDIRYSRAAPNASPGTGWAMPEASRFDDFVYKFQDKNVDLKRAIAGITKDRQALEDNIDAYLQEELFHERAAKRTQDFTKDELGPIMKDMAARGITLEALDEYLHNRHAEEANKVAAERNKDADGNSTMPDGGSGIKTADARAYLAKLDASKRKRLEAVAAKVDAIIAKTRQTLVDYGLESQTVTDGWASQFEHYVPLMREDEGGGMGTGQGFSIKGKESKSRTGSTDRKVVDILANIAMQRERAIVRGEKNRVAVAMVGLVDANPAPDFWQADRIPTERVFNERTGLVEERQIMGFKNRPNVLVAKVMGPNGDVQERAIVFNERNPRAMRMAESLKNLDASELEGLLGVSAKITRYFAAINTQYNPVFGFVNFIRDVQGAIINLQSTALKGSEKAVMKDVMPALAGVYADARKVRQGGVATSKWANLWEEFQNEGGATGFRDLFRTSEDRANAIKREIDPTAWMNSPMGKVFTANGNLKVPLAQAQKGATWIFDWLSDYNLAMENAVRLSAYKAALDQGMTKQRAASLAKNLTVNFNRKGQAGMQAGAVYAFFNAAMQGTARMGDVMFEGQGAGQRLSSLGRKIIYGGMALGAMQAMALADAGFDEEEPPPFVRERSLVIPIGALVGGKEYISIPMPLGWHVIPGLGREATEFALSGFKDPGKRLVNLVALFADAFNPIGNAGMSLQTISPTGLDPLVALSENRDWTGKPIARESFDRTTPGFALAKDTASAPAKWISEMINAASGGTQYTAGILSPTPDQIDYLWGQVTGGLGREIGKVEQTVTAAFTGETLPTYKVPLVGRFVGDAEGPTSQGNRFYENLNQINLHEAQIKGLRKDGKTEEVAQYLADNPEASLISIANMAERQVRRMRARKRELLANDAPREDIQQIEVQITNAMTRLNEAVKRRELAGV